MHRRSESAFKVEAFRAIIFQRRSEPLFFTVSIQIIDVQSQRLELMIDQGFVYRIPLHDQL